MKEIIVIFLLIISGCSTSAVKYSESTTTPTERLYADQVKRPKNATITVIRDSGMIGAGCYLGFYINGKIVGDLDTGENANFYVLPGNYRLGTGNAKWANGLCKLEVDVEERETHIEAGQRKFFRMFIDQDGNRDIKPVSE